MPRSTIPHSKRLHGNKHQSHNRNGRNATFPKQPTRGSGASRSSKIVSWILKTLFASAIFLVFQFFPDSPVETNRNLEQVWGIEKHHVAQSISDDLYTNEFPSVVTLASDNYDFNAIVHYNIEPELNNYIDDLILHYRPDYTAVVAIQPHTGRIVAMSSYTKGESFSQNLAVHSGFPAASIFKIVTAAAVIDTGNANPGSIYKYNGKNTSLYKSNVLRHKNNKWTRKTSLSRAFALSINTVFGRIGVFDVGAESLREYADTFGFNQPLPVDISIESSKTGFHGDDEWSIAEAASGYTRSTTISPVHAAMIASVVANDGVLIEPNLVDFAVDTSGPLLYRSEPNAVQILEKQTTDDLRVLMRATVKKGSARKHFRTFFRGPYANLDVGGKTGSLTGYNPKGRTEWFVGYADSGDDKIAVATVVVNKEKWRVKPAYLTRKILEEYFRPDPAKG